MSPTSGALERIAKDCTKEDSDSLTKKCSVRLFPLDIDVKTILNMEDPNASPPSTSKDIKDPQKRDIETYHPDGPQMKKQKSDDVIIIDPEDKPPDRIPKPATPDVTVIKVKATSPKDCNSSCSPKEKEKKSSPGDPKVKQPTDKPTLQRTGSFDSIRKTESKDQKSSKTSSSSSSSSTSTLDKTDRTSLQCLEQKLLDLQKATQKTKHTSDFLSSKPKSLSPSGLKQSKDLYHRRKEDFITERKKINSSPKKLLKKAVSLPQTKDKMGNLFCPTTDAKVTILPINKPNAKDLDNKLPSTSNSVTITKLSSGDSLSVPAKDIKKVFSPKSDMKSDMKSKVSPNSALKSQKFKLGSFSKTEKHRSGDKNEKLHKEHKHREREGQSRERERSRENSKHNHCSKCNEQFSTKEAKKLHTCNSILDAHYLIDERDRQKTSPTSSAGNSERSESTSASLSRSSSRSSSPGIPVSNPAKKPDTPKLKLTVKSDSTDDKLGKVKISLKKGDEARAKRDSPKEKWVESKSSFKNEDSASDNISKDRTCITIEAVKLNNEGNSDNLMKHPASSLQIVKIDGEESRKEGKDDASSMISNDRLEHAFAFTGKRTYSPSMSDTTVDGKGKMIKIRY